MRNYRIKITSFLAIALIGALVLAACGGSASEQTEVLTADQIVKEDHDEDETSGSESDDDHVEDADEHEDEEGDDHDDEEGDDHLHVEVPPEYADLINPVEGDDEALMLGATLFDVTCSSCHGPTGMGDGEAAASLDPKPASLADADMMADVSDGYLFWRISEGGAMEPFNSLMPAWGSGFTDGQIWQLVTFVRSLSE